MNHLHGNMEDGDSRSFQGKVWMLWANERLAMTAAQMLDESNWFDRYGRRVAQVRAQISASAFRFMTSRLNNGNDEQWRGSRYGARVWEGVCEYPPSDGW